MQKNKKDLKNNNSVTLEIEKNLPEKYCPSRCKICSSPYLIEIHNLKKTGATFDSIISAMKKHNIIYSKASLSRHFQNYYKHKTALAAKIINNDLIEEATSQSVHIKRLVNIIDNAFDIIEAKINAGNYLFSVDDLDKLLKLRYQVLLGKNDSEKDVLAIFQKASTKYGLNLNQGILFSPADSQS